MKSVTYALIIFLLGTSLVDAKPKRNCTWYYLDYKYKVHCSKGHTFWYVFNPIGY